MVLIINKVSATLKMLEFNVVLLNYHQMLAVLGYLIQDHQIQDHLILDHPILKITMVKRLESLSVFPLSFSL